MKSRGYKIWIAIVLSALLLGACNAEETAKKDGNLKKETGTEVAKDKAGNTFPTKTSNSAESIEGGHLNYGIVTDSPFEGLLNWTFYQSTYDESLLSTDENYVFSQDGAATYEMSEDNKTITLTIRDNVKWQDGNPVTGEDLEFAYLTIGHPDYKGVRYDALFQSIEGMEEYHAGKADHISGIKVDGNKISISFKEANPSILTGLWT
jgi:peptide/nickel transport system substrate-binding protein